MGLDNKECFFKDRHMPDSVRNVQGVTDKIPGWVTKPYIREAAP
jgi:hypothetical protein